VRLRPIPRYHLMTHRACGLCCDQQLARHPHFLSSELLCVKTVFNNFLFVIYTIIANGVGIMNSRTIEARAPVRDSTERARHLGNTWLTEYVRLKAFDERIGTIGFQFQKFRIKTGVSKRTLNGSVFFFAPEKGSRFGNMWVW